MVKQFTAIILVLAIANPLCCCFGFLAAQAPSQDYQSPSPPPIRSCCQANYLPSDNQDESPKDDAPSCPAGCACKQVFTQAENETFKPAQVLKDNIAVCRAEIVEQYSSPFAVEIFSKALAWRPPPPKNASFRSLYCISRT